MWSVLGMAVATLFVPGAPIDIQFGLTREIFNSSILFLFASPVIGILLAVAYHKVYPRFPAALRTRPVAISWKDLRLPGVMAIISIVLGLLIIT